MHIVLYISNPVPAPLGISKISDSDFSICAVCRGDTLLKLLPFVQLKEHISAACTIKNCYKRSDNCSTDKCNILYRFSSSAITALHLHHVWSSYPALGLNLSASIMSSGLISGVRHHSLENRSPFIFPDSK